MKMIFCYSFRNVRRTPIRTCLYFLILFLMVTTTLVCQGMYSAGKSALSQLENTYQTVATASMKIQTNPDGTQTVSPRFLTLDEAKILAASETVQSFNIELLAGNLAAEEILYELPSQETLEREPLPIIVETETCTVYATNDLFLTRPFFSGDSVIIAGEMFSSEMYAGGSRVIIIPEIFAEHYGLSVGDSVTYQFRSQGGYATYTICGIYRSASGVDVAYIPFEDYSREYMIFLSSKVFLSRKGTGTMPDQVRRLDFLLRSPNDAEAFIEDAVSGGFDIARYDITVNDRPYKMLRAELRDLCRVSLVVLVSVLASGAVLLFLVSFFYQTSKEKEKRVLHALGMKMRQIRVIIVCELCMIGLAALMFGTATGAVLSQRMLQHWDNTRLEEVSADSNQDFSSGSLSTDRLLTLHRDVDISLASPEVSGVEDEVQEQTGREIYYTYEGERLLIVGKDQANGMEMPTEGSHPFSICMDPNRVSNLSFVCYATKDSPYGVGDVIFIAPQNLTESIVMLQDSYTQELPVFMSLNVIGLWDEDSQADLIMPQVELDLLHDYTGFCSLIYHRSTLETTGEGTEND